MLPDAWGRMLIYGWATGERLRAPSGGSTSSGKPRGSQPSMNSEPLSTCPAQMSSRLAALSRSLAERARRHLTRPDRLAEDAAHRRLARRVLRVPLRQLLWNAAFCANIRIVRSPVLSQLVGYRSVAPEGPLGHDSSRRC